MKRKSYNDCLYRNSSSWKAFGPHIQPGDRLRIDQMDQMPMGTMQEDEKGVFVFLPKANHHFYEGKDSEKVEIILTEINSLIDELKTI